VTPQVTHRFQDLFLGFYEVSNAALIPKSVRLTLMKGKQKVKQQNNVFGLLRAVPQTGLSQFVIMIFLITGCGKPPAPIAADKVQAIETNPAAAIPVAKRIDSDPIYRVRVDHQRGRYWVLGDDHVQVYNAAGKRLISKVMIPGWNVAGSVGLPDLVLDRSGAALVSSNAVPMLWHIDPERFSVTRKEILLQTRENWDVGFSGLAFTPEGTLLGVTAFEGTLWKIDTHSEVATQIELSRHLLDARELWVVYQRASTSTLFDTVLCVSTGMEFYEVKLDANKNAAVVQRASLGCTRSS
jgi:hypothetical protein